MESSWLGTDRIAVHRGPCHCGTGEFLIEWCEPDPPSLNQDRYESSIECSSCNSRFSIMQRGDHFVLVQNAHIDARHDLRNEVLTRRETFMNRADVQDLLTQLSTRLDSFRYRTEAYRFLRKHGFCPHVTRPVFSKQWSSGTEWVERHVTSPEQIHNVTAALGYGAIKVFDADLREIERVESQMKAPIPIVGELIYKSEPS